MIRSHGWRLFSALVFVTGSLAAATVDDHLGADTPSPPDWTLASSATHGATGTPPGHATLSGVELTPEAVYADKGRPDLLGPPSAPPGLGDVHYFYAGVHAPEAWSDLTSIVDGASVLLSQHSPQVTRGDYHSLAELAVASADTSQVVEVGWTVDSAVNSNDRRNPYLFVYHWVNGQPTCYNGCGWVQVSKSRMPGMRVAITEVPQDYAIDFHDGNWWVRYQGEWIGYFPGSLWDGSFTSAAWTQWFGEVATRTREPCADMGWADFGSSHGPQVATMTNLTWRLAGRALETRAPVSSRTFVTQPTAYDLGSATAELVEYGGPGFC
jgi:hypothetical protein